MISVLMNSADTIDSAVHPLQTTVIHSLSDTKPVHQLYDGVCSREKQPTNYKEIITNSNQNIAQRSSLGLLKCSTPAREAGLLKLLYI